MNAELAGLIEAYKHRWDKYPGAHFGVPDEVLWIERQLANGIVRHMPDVIAAASPEQATELESLFADYNAAVARNSGRPWDTVPADLRQARELLVSRAKEALGLARSPDVA